MPETAIKRAHFIKKKDESDRGEEVPIHFNPVSLQYTINNSLKESDQNGTKKQFVSQSSSKLSMDLIFDTTDTGEDVRLHTGKLARFMETRDAAGGGRKQVPPIVMFQWGAFKFQGMVESYKETLDFFSATGVPLRASVSLGMASQDKVFEPDDPSQADTQGQLGPEPVVLPSAGGADTSRLGALAGDAGAGRAIAAANGLESMRFSSGPIAISGSIPLRGPVAFASGGAGIGISAGAGAGLSAGVSGGIGIGGGIGVSGGISAGVRVGGAASAGVTASAGAFAGLRAPRRSGLSVALESRRLLPQNTSTGVSTGRGASFHVGGQARPIGSSSLSADVGVHASLEGRLRFEE